MRDRQRTGFSTVDVDQRRQRNGATGERRFHVDAVERRDGLLLVGQDLENDEIGLELCEILGDLPLTERVVKRVVDKLGRYPEARRLITIDGDLQLRRVGEEGARH